MPPSPPTTLSTPPPLGSVGTVRATAVRQDVEWYPKQNTVLAEDLKCLFYYIINKLNRTHLAGDLKRKG